MEFREIGSGERFSCTDPLYRHTDCGSSHALGTYTPTPGSLHYNAWRCHNCMFDPV